MHSCWQQRCCAQQLADGLRVCYTVCWHAGLSCLVRPGFFLSFYFWLDTVAVLSLAFELPALRAALLLGETQVGAVAAAAVLCA